MASSDLKNRSARPRIVSDTLNPPQLSHLEQYKMLREEIMQCIRETYRTEMVVAIAAGTAYAWLLSYGQTVPRIAWFVPPFVIFAATLRLLNLWLQIKFIAEYLRLVEEAAFGNGTKLRGWERYTKAGGHRPFAFTCNIVAGILWIVALAVSIVASWHLSQGYANWFRLNAKIYNAHTMGMDLLMGLYQGLK